MDLKVPDWKWNVWEIDPKTGRRKKWLGMIMDPKTGFEWLRKQGMKASKYRINNVPPESGVTPNPAYEVYATEDNNLHKGEDLPIKVMAPKTDYEPKRKKSKEPMTEKVAQARKNLAVRRQPQVPDSPEMKAIKEDAAKMLDQHKADEAAEMAESEKRAEDWSE